LQKIGACATLATVPDHLRLCTENVCKALALCAARSHIVAVR
jgi:hypothetical protein